MMGRVLEPDETLELLDLVYSLPDEDGEEDTEPIYVKDLWGDSNVESLVSDHEDFIFTRINANDRMVFDYISAVREDEDTEDFPDFPF
jgi:hypothetical protein